jgi:hypothetical protein
MDKPENKKYELIAKSLSCPWRRSLQQLPLSPPLNPNRAASTDEETIYISPDIYVFKMGITTRSSSMKTGCPN